MINNQVQNCRWTNGCSTPRRIPSQFMTAEQQYLAQNGIAEKCQKRNASFWYCFRNLNLPMDNTRWIMLTQLAPFYLFFAYSFWTSLPRRNMYVSYWVQFVYLNPILQLITAFLASYINWQSSTNSLYLYLFLYWMNFKAQNW